MAKNRAKPYRFLEFTLSLCSCCGERVQAKIVLRDDAIYLLKQCPEHGEHAELLEEDAGFYLARHDFDKPGTISKPQTEINRGCPYDCGLCPNHEQHTCIALLEVTRSCDLNCPVCFAESRSDDFLDLPTIERMLNLYQDAEFNEAEVLQISGGEPTTHPRILDIIKLAKAKGLGFVMLNTNGLRIADDLEFVEALGQLTPGFEVYLQFDGFERKTHETLRGHSDLLAVKERALANLERFKVPVTLVATVQQGVNEHEIGRIVQYGMAAPNVRGVNLQPLALFGRHPAVERERRITLTGILRRLEQQTHGMLRMHDFIPLPCDVDRVAVTYCYRQNGEFVPVTRNADIRKYLSLVKNTFLYDAGDILKQTATGLFNGRQFCQCLNFLKDFLPLAPVGKNLSMKGGKLTYAIENTFRISVTSFIDRYNFDIKSQQKECVHVLTPDLRRIPFSAYNMLYRGTGRRQSPGALLFEKNARGLASPF